MAKLEFLLILGFVVNLQILYVEQVRGLPASQHQDVKGNKFLSHADVSDKNPRVKNKIFRDKMKQFLKISFQIINPSIDRMGDLSFTVQANVRHQTTESNELLESFEKQK